MKNKPIKIPEDYKIINDKNSLIIGSSKYGNIGIKTKNLENKWHQAIFSDLRMLIIGQSGCGKTELCKKIITEICNNTKLIPIIIDCEGEYKELNSICGCNVNFRIINFELSGEKLIVTSDFQNLQMNSIKDILTENIKKRIPLIFNLSKVNLEFKQKIAIDICNFFMDIDSYDIDPVVLVCDSITELQYKASYVRSCIGKELIDKLKYFMNMARMRGHSCIFVGQRLNYANMSSDVLASFNSMLIGKITNDFDLKRLNEINQNIDFNLIKNFNKNLNDDNLNWEFCAISSYNYSDIFDHDNKYPIVFNSGCSDSYA